MMPSSVKTTLITGGAKRIGAAMVRQFHAKGHQILLHYRHSKETAQSLQNELNLVRPNTVQLIQVDLCEHSAPEHIMATCLETYGRLDVLVNNASAFFPTPIASASFAEWDQLMDSNLKAPFFLSQAAAPTLRQHQGCIINLIDIYAQRPLADHPIYAASKAGLASLTHSMARDLAPDIRVNGIAPGAILWPEAHAQTVEAPTKPTQDALIARTPLQRLGAPKDIAQTALFLADKAPFITGQIIAVDGGRSIVP